MTAPVACDGEVGAVASVLQHACRVATHKHGAVGLERVAVVQREHVLLGWNCAVVCGNLACKHKQQRGSEGARGVK